jgi:hypothetical protein
MPEQVDRMDVLARLFVIVYPNGDPYGVRTDKAMAESYARNMGAGWGVVEYVPADQSRGAVKAMLVARSHLAAADHVRYEQAIKMLDAALPDELGLGGQ